MDPSKVHAIKDHVMAHNTNQNQTFLGMVKFTTKFMPKYSKVSYPLIQLLRKLQKFICIEECKQNYAKLKEIIASTIILSYLDFKKPFFCVYICFQQKTKSHISAKRMQRYDQFPLLVDHSKKPRKSNPQWIRRFFPSFGLSHGSTRISMEFKSSSFDSPFNYQHSPNRLLRWASRDVFANREVFANTLLSFI